MSTALDTHTVMRPKLLHAAVGQGDSQINSLQSAMFMQMQNMLSHCQEPMITLFPQRGTQQKQLQNTQKTDLPLAIEDIQAAEGGEPKKSIVAARRESPPKSRAPVYH